MTHDAVIIDVIRTPVGRGKPGGMLSGVHPVDLLAGVLTAIVDRNDLDPALVDDVIGGCVSQIGEQSYNVTRNALLAAGFPESVPGTTIDRQCGSSQQAATFAAQAVLAGQADIVIACGVESMSRVPLGSSAAGADPFGSRLRARYPEGLVNQGVSAELIAAKWGFSRDELDGYAARSHALAAEAGESGAFATEVVPVSGVDRLVDETVRPGTTVDSLAALNPSFRTDALAERFPDVSWNITPGNSSPLTDGASAALIMSADAAERLGLEPRARFRAFSVVGSDPLYMLTGVIPATAKVLERAGLTHDDMDAYEVNEAFASVPLAWLADTGADVSKLNPRGGAIALGHALGSSGTRLLTTLVNQLEATDGTYGLQVMCEGGGMANATIIERL
ncbi:acetyl-CoA acetyltransferase family protein [Agromyces flavus]|uniref:Acetyl-CoA acetyltransferase family protein n=1 Tax=Agromyces flavus TaxID=589382 RepID=A0A1H1UWZ6_9MICO|nr:thiolase family protein [Agromyces flavus]MCP2368125.1 acetyl-CoA acetyltransferase family protein [Agromyces flavus]GGI47586.1 putative acyl-CoA thiolase [Agromyces flavus]SDS76781.1 Thiolase, C-terminal domain [Agromyces flavus]